MTDYVPDDLKWGDVFLVKTVMIPARYRLVVVSAVGCLLIAGAAGMTQYKGRPASVPQENATSSVATMNTTTAPEVQFSSNEMRTSGDGEYLSFTESAWSRLAYRAARPSVLTHVVAEGESTWAIAEQYATDLGSIQALNAATDTDSLVPGETLRVVPNFSGLVHKVREGDTIEQVAVTYGISLEQILTVNRMSANESLEIGTLVFVPGARVRAQVASRGESQRRAPEPTAPPAPPQTQAAAIPPAPASTRGWAWPLTGGVFFSEYGYREGGFHRGLDIAAPTGTPAVAARGGTVIAAAWDNGYGLSVIIDHGDGIKTRYAHASKLLVSSGQTVTQGQQVILVGSTGNSTGPHLHFEVLVNGDHVNPRQYLP